MFKSYLVQKKKTLFSERKNFIFRKKTLFSEKKNY